MTPALRRLAVPSLGIAAGVQFAPSVLVLGQWLPQQLPRLRSLPGGVVHWRGPANNRRELALTFDDGPDPDWTPRVLDILDEHGLEATFFCLGEQVAAHPGFAKEIVRRGHEVGTHGFLHRHHLASSFSTVREDLAEAVAVTEQTTGQPVRYFRAPYGQVSGGSLVAARRLGLELVLWSAWGREWTDRDPSSVAARVQDHLEPSAIVLLHDSDRSAPPGTGAVAITALQRLAGEIHERGLRSATLSELLRS